MALYAWIKMKVEEVGLEGLLLFHSEVYSDSRGFLYERYNRDVTKRLNTTFVQQNVSVSKAGVLRGMHWQFPPHAQGKLVTCLSGAIYDVAVDLRLKSATFGKHYATTLGGGSAKSLWIPKGFAHGFQSLEDNSVVTYSVDNDFAPSFSKEFNPFDPNVGIQWPAKNPILSAKDEQAVNLQNLEPSFLFE